MMKATIEKGSLYIFDCDIDLYRTFNCGQAFRWKSVSDSVFTCVLGERIVTVSKEADCIAISPCESEIDKAFYTHYFDLERDYTAIEDYMLSNTVLSRCIPYAKGIRILNQAPFETLISFIISANNNIKRISKTIDNLCAAAGRRIGDTNHYTFPTPQSIADLSIEDLLKIGTGYRASYIKGSGDSSITDVVPNDIESIIKSTQVKAIFVNGKTASRLYDKYIFPKTNIKAIALPSTSPANAARSLENLIKAWSVILEHLS
jgi:hypothetical protein